jgi:hypothetical protein
MKNIPRTKKEIKEHPAVSSFKKEYDDGSNYSYWIYLKDDWICKSMECRLIHEQTIAEVTEKFRTVEKS